MNIADVRNNEWSMSLKEQGGIVEGFEDINQCLYIILTTVPGSLPGDPEFGCDMYLYADQTPDRAIPQIIKSMATAIEKYEPRIRIEKISYKLDMPTFEDAKKQPRAIFNIAWTSDIKAGSGVAYTFINGESKEIQGFDYIFDFNL